MSQQTLIPHLYRTEFRKITAVLSRRFGLAQVEIAEDIVCDTFLLATETWGRKGIPDNPTAWLYAVAKNKALDYLKRRTLVERKATEVARNAPLDEQGPELDWSEVNILDSQLRMIFAVCHPAIAAEAQIGLALRILCGFGIGEIAEAFLTSKETVNKRLTRAKAKLRQAKVTMEFPALTEITSRLNNVLTTLYLLFNEGYYSSTQNATLR